MADKTAKRWERTISADLHEAWKTLRRPGDVALIMEETGMSRPVVDRALNSGYVSLPDLIDKINSFFQSRLERENKKAKDLLALSQQ